MFLAPIAHLVIGRQPRLQRPTHGRGLVDVGKLQAHPAHIPAHTIKGLGILHVDQGQSGIVLVHPHIEDPHHAETP